MHHQLPLFWSRHPALLYGLSALWGSAYALYPHFWMLFLVTPLFLTCWNWKKILSCLVIAIVCMTFTHKQYIIPQPIDEPLSGTAVLKIRSIKETKSAFGDAHFYIGILQSFVHEDQEIAKGIPVNLSEPQEADIRSLDKIYRIEGKLRQNAKGRFTFSPDKGRAWEEVRTLWTLAPWRHEAKATIQGIINENISDPHVASFLSGIAVGEFDDMQLSFELGKLGLQHLMAISGLHFSILAGILAFFLGVILGKRAAAVVVMTALTLYFIFLGYSPSVLRAWVAIVLTLLTLFVHRRCNGLNSLGIGFLAIALVDPLAITTIAFQFSFGVTASILLWYQPCDRLLEIIFPTRSLSKITGMHSLDQHIYCSAYYLRQALALALAVNIAALPITLYYFHQFPLLSLVYNLFFPFLVSFSILLLVLALPLHVLIPPLGHFLFWLDDCYTGFLLNFIFNLPSHFHSMWTLKEISSTWAFTILFVTFSLGVIVREYQHDEEKKLFSVS